MKVRLVVRKGIGFLENREGRMFASLCGHTEILTDDNNSKYHYLADQIRISKKLPQQ